MQTQVQTNEIKSLHNIIDKFKNRSDVVNGNAIGWKSKKESTPTLFNRPISVGDGLSTTGWCVSASEALLNDNIFQGYLQIYGGYARLVSIDIKEQYHGYCYNGSQNKWHTAILLTLPLQDGKLNGGVNMNYIVDLTCGQFGDAFVNKNVWTVEAWMSKFRSPLCTHTILTNDGKELTVNPTGHYHKEHDNSDFEKLRANYNLKNFTSIDANERNLLLTFIDKFNLINNKLIVGNVDNDEIELINNVVDIYKTKMHQEYKINKGYTSLMFKNKESAINWLDYMLDLTKNNGLINIDFELKQNMFIFESVLEAKKHFGFTENGENSYILNIEFNNVTAFKGFTTNVTSYLLFLGTKLNTEISENLIIKQSENESLVIFNES